MDGVPAEGLVLLCQYLSHFHQQISSVLLEQRLNANVELLMPLDSVSIVEHCGNQMSMLYVHVFEPVTLFLLVQRIKQGLFQVHTFNIQNHDERLVVALVAEEMEQGTTRVINVYLLMDQVCRCTQVRHQIQHYVFESQVAILELLN